MICPGDGCEYGVICCEYGDCEYDCGEYGVCASWGVAICCRNEGATVGTLDAGATTDCGMNDGNPLDIIVPLDPPIIVPLDKYPVSVTGSILLPRIYFLDAGVAALTMCARAWGGTSPSGTCAHFAAGTLAMRASASGSRLPAIMASTLRSTSARTSADDTRGVAARRRLGSGRYTFTICPAPVDSETTSSRGGSGSGSSLTAASGRRRTRAVGRLGGMRYCQKLN